MERSEQRSIAEALILASPEPIPLPRLASLIPSCKPALARALVDELNAEYAKRGRAFEIWEVAGGFQLRTLPAFASYVQASQPERPLRLSQAALETLAVVAYRQPVTRAEIEYVRGVDAGAVLRSLLERHLVRIAGHREVPGRPLLYATTPALPRGLRAGADRGSADAARAGRARADGPAEGDPTPMSVEMRARRRTPEPPRRATTREAPSDDADLDLEPRIPRTPTSDDEATSTSEPTRAQARPARSSRERPPSARASGAPKRRRGLAIPAEKLGSTLGTFRNRLI